MRILTIFAHPDDETIFTGGTLVLLNRAGTKIHFLCATRGEGGELGEPPVSSRTDIHVFREGELRQAIKALGGGTLSFLGYFDPLIGDNEQLYPYTEDFESLVEKIIDCIQDFQPDAIITHGSNGEYGHPGHILTNKATKIAAIKIRKNPPTLYTFGANYPNHPRPRHANPDDPAHLIVDVNSAMQEKTNAAYCYHSQHALFLRRSSKQAGFRLTIPEILLNVESFHRAHPSTTGETKDDLFHLLKPYLIKKTESYLSYRPK